MGSLGFKDDAGSWKTIPVWRRIGKSSFCDALEISLPTISNLPDLTGSSPIAALPTVVLPEPDSPTSPTISPG